MYDHDPFIVSNNIHIDKAENENEIIMLEMDKESR